MNHYNFKHFHKSNIHSLIFSILFYNILVDEFNNTNYLLLGQLINIKLTIYRSKIKRYKDQIIKPFKIL